MEDLLAEWQAVGCIYTLKDTFPGEEADTLALLAHDHNCNVEDITVSIENGTPK